MSLLADSTILTVGGVIAASGLIVNLLTIRKLAAPRPPNQDLDKSITRLDTEVAEHERRLTAIEQARIACHLNHLAELDKLYRLSNAAATAATAANEKLDLLIRLTRETQPHG